MTTREKIERSREVRLEYPDRSAIAKGEQLAKEIREEIPQFASEDDEREFWANRDSTDYTDTATSVVLEHDKTTREEIREKIVLFIKAVQAHGEDPEYWADDILTFLDSQGVVRKVENVGIDLTYAYEVTGNISDTDLNIIANAVEEAYKSAGYVAT